MDFIIDGYQFIHMDWSTRLRAAKTTVIKTDHGKFKASGWSARDLLAEAMRVEGHCPHVKTPVAPGIVYACTHQIAHDPSTVGDLGEAWAVSVKEVKGRALSTLSPVMSNGVISFPKEREEEWPSFRNSCVDYLKDKYGDRLKLIVEHTDEAHPHIHYYCVPLHGIDENGVAFSADFGTVHQGYGESRAVRKKFIKENGKNATNENGKKYTKGAGTRKAYVDSMKSFQDEFHDKVGKFYGLGRVGPRVKKLSHSEAIREKNIRKAEADLLAAEKIRRTADEELERSIKISHQASIENAQVKKRIIEELKCEMEHLKNDSNEKAMQQAKELIDMAEQVAHKKKRTIDALLAGNDVVALRVYKENIALRERLSEAEKYISNAEKLVATLKDQLKIAQTWICAMVAKFESAGDFSFSNIFAKKSIEVVEESKGKGIAQRPGV